MEALGWTVGMVVLAGELLVVLGAKLVSLHPERLADLALREILVVVVVVVEVAWVPVGFLGVNRVVPEALEALVVVVVVVVVVVIASSAAEARGQLAGMVLVKAEIQILHPGLAVVVEVVVEVAHLVQAYS